MIGVPRETVRPPSLLSGRRPHAVFPARDGLGRLSAKTVTKQVSDRQMRFKTRKALRDR